MKRLILCVLILVSTLGYSGCLYLPVAYTRSGTSPVDPSFIKAGVTTKEDVVLRYGDPSRVSDDQRVFVYNWDTFLGGIRMSCDIVPLDEVTYLKIYFDENDVARKYSLENKYE